MLILWLRRIFLSAECPCPTHIDRYCVVGVSSIVCNAWSRAFVNRSHNCDDDAVNNNSNGHDDDELKITVVLMVDDGDVDGDDEEGLRRIVLMVAMLMLVVPIMNYDD